MRTFALVPLLEMIICLSNNNKKHNFLDKLCQDYREIRRREVKKEEDGGLRISSKVFLS